MDENILDLFHIEINSVEMTVRMANFIAANRIQTLGDLVQLTEDDLMKLTYTPEDSDQKVQFGQSDLSELKAILEARDLKPGMAVTPDIRNKVDFEIKRLKSAYDQLQKERQELQKRWNEIQTKKRPPLLPNSRSDKMFDTLLKNYVSTPLKVHSSLPKLQSKIEYLKEKVDDLTIKIEREEKL